MTATAAPAVVDVRVTRYSVTAWPHGVPGGSWERFFELYVEWTGPGDRWAIRSPMGDVFCRSHARRTAPEGVWEPRPSARTAAFLRTYRFSHNEALDLAQRIAPRLRRNGMDAPALAAWLTASRAEHPGGTD